MLEIIVLMYNLVPYSRTALFLRRLQPDPSLEPGHAGAAMPLGPAAAPREGDAAMALPRGSRPGTGLVPTVPSTPRSSRRKDVASAR